MKSSELKKYVSLREDVTSDQYVCGQVCGEYKKLPIKDRVVLDLGGNIGAFAVYASLLGCKQCISYEPDVDNYNLLQTNTRSYSNIIIHQAAVITKSADAVRFYKTTGSAKDGYSIIPFRGRVESVVPAVSFKSVLEKYKPSTIKMDIEGAEFDLLIENDLPAYVKDIIVEIHFSKKEFREKYHTLVSRFKNWNVIIQPKVTEKNFHTLGQWSR